MSVVRLGTTKQYADNWDNIFSGKRRSSSVKRTARPGAKSAKKKAANKKAQRKPAKKVARSK